MNVLVLGGTGYLGKKIVNRLLQEKMNVYCIIHNTKIEFTGNIQFIQLKDIEGYIASQNICFDLFINLACAYERENTITKICQTNLQIPMNILNRLVDNNKILKFINVSTSLPREYNNYSYTKNMMSEYGEFLARQKRIKYIDIKLEAFYGVDEPDNRFITWLIKNMLENKRILLTEGTQIRDYIYIDDVVDGVIQIINTTTEDYLCIPFQTGNPPTIREIVLYLKSLTSTNSEIIFGAIGKNTLNPSTSIDTSVMKKLDIELKVGWKTGMKRMVDYQQMG